MQKRWTVMWISFLRVEGQSWKSLGLFMQARHTQTSLVSTWQDHVINISYIKVNHYFGSQPLKIWGVLSVSQIIQLLPTVRYLSLAWTKVWRCEHLVVRSRWSCFLHSPEIQPLGQWVKQSVWWFPNLWAELIQRQSESHSSGGAESETDDITALSDRSQWAGIIKSIPGTPFLVSHP